MGFMDKLKQLKDENRNLVKTTKRMNSVGAFFGNVNRGVKNGDFWEGSYVNLEDGKMVIYGSNQDDYVFGAGDLASCEPLGGGDTIPVRDQKLPSQRVLLTFKDGKKAQADILSNKLGAFQKALGL